MSHKVCKRVKKHFLHRSTIYVIKYINASYKQFLHLNCGTNFMLRDLQISSYELQYLERGHGLVLPLHLLQPFR
jgi:hypothetical protein